jgi:nitroreductase
LSIELEELKEADTLPSVHELIRERWSPRAFSNQPVSSADLAAILEAGRWAASSYNEQPWRFFVAPKSDAAGFGKLLGLLMPMNQAWAGSAAVLMLSVAKKSFSHNGQANRYGLHDAGAALAGMFLQATALGLHGHGMGGFDHERARLELHVPDDYEIGAAAAFGYLGSSEHLPEQMQKMELAKRQRKPLAEIVFSTEWQKPLAL